MLERHVLIAALSGMHVDPERCDCVFEVSILGTWKTAVRNVSHAPTTTVRQSNRQRNKPAATSSNPSAPRPLVFGSMIRGHSLRFTSRFQAIFLEQKYWLAQTVPRILTAVLAVQGKAQLTDQ
jgi:hypothetical protein